jgi:hypothetical protein
MRQDREHPLYHLDAETLLVATYVWVDDELKALQAQGFKLPKKQKHQKAILAELLTLAIFLLLQGQDLAKGYLAAKTTLKAYFPSLPHLSRFYRVLQKAGPEGPGHLAEPYTFPPPGGLPPPPLLAGFMRGTPEILRNSMQATPRSRPRKGLPLREGELSRRWGACTSDLPYTMEA